MLSVVVSWFLILDLAAGWLQVLIGNEKNFYVQFRSWR